MFLTSQTTDLTESISQTVHQQMNLLPIWTEQNCCNMSQHLAFIDNVNENFKVILGDTIWQSFQELIKNNFNDYFKDMAHELTTWTEIDENHDPWKKWLAAVCLFFIATKLNILPSKYDFIMNKINLFLPPTNTLPPEGVTGLILNNYEIDLRYILN